MKAKKKIPYYSVLFLLTIGASLILGFLSFGGMFALWPILGLAISSLILSVGYEGEIYYQNIKGALNKLLKRNHIEQYLANEFLLKHFPDTKAEDCPKFFKDYKKQLKLFHEFGHKRLDKESETRKQQVEKTLRDMEKWYATQLFPNPKRKTTATPYETELATWHEQHQDKMEVLRARAKKHRIGFNLSKIFAVLAGIFMCAGTSYLLVGAFLAIPVLATIPYTILPMIILPMAIIAGAAYSMLIYNAITDMIANDTLRKWYFSIRKDWNEGNKKHAVIIGCVSVILAALAITLTICTAGTWWTVAKNARPLFTWMSKMPTFIMGILNPIIVGLSSIIFNVQNTSESLGMIDHALRPKKTEADKIGFFTRTKNALNIGFRKLKAEENWLQILNPFRILLKLTLLPLRILLFIGHLISMGVSDDRVPGIPELLAAIFGTTSEFFEDFHFFFHLAGADPHCHDHKENSSNECHGDKQQLEHEHDHKHEHEHEHKHEHEHEHKHEHDHKHEHEHKHEHDHKHEHKHDHDHSIKGALKERLSKGHGHSHDNDLPTRFLNLIFLPIYLAAAGWDYAASRRNTTPDARITFRRAWEKQWGLSEKQSVAPKKMAPASAGWQRQHAIYRIDRHREKHLQTVTAGKEIALKKEEQLSAFQERISGLNLKENKDGLNELMTEEAKKDVYREHRFFSSKKCTKTTTESFLAELPERVIPYAKSCSAPHR